MGVHVGRLLGIRRRKGVYVVVVGRRRVGVVMWGRRRVMVRGRRRRVCWTMRRGGRRESSSGSQVGVRERRSNGRYNSASAQWI